MRLRTLVVRAALILAAAAHSAAAYTISFTDADFTMTPVFNSLVSFSFTIDVAGPLAPGTYNNPTLNGIEYSVRGVLGGTPSGFPAFNLVRSITGADFYAQGSSLLFTIAAGADLSDGLQVSELQGPDPVFVLNAREVGTGRYHPPFLQLNGDGTGIIQNSNNMGGINPVTMMEVNVGIGEEYIVNLGFSPTATTLADVPEPQPLICLALAAALGFALPRRNMSDNHK